MRRFFDWNSFGIVCLIIISCGMFAITLNYETIGFQNNQLVTQNPHVQTGLTPSGLQYAIRSMDAGFWTPLTWISYQSAETLGQSNTGWAGLLPKLTTDQWSSLQSILLHTANTVLIYCLLRALSVPGPGAFVVAALFAIHPLNVQAVVSLASRSILLGAFFLLAGMLFDLNRVGSRGRNSLLSMICFTFAFLAHPLTLIAPFLLVLIDRFLPRKGTQARDLASQQKTIFETVSLNSETSLPHQEMTLQSAWRPHRFQIGLACSFLMLHLMLAIQSEKLIPLSAHSLQARIAQSVASTNWYLGKMVLPTNLSLVYPLPADSTNWGLFFVGSGILLSILCGVVLAQKRFPALALAWYAFLLGAVPVSGLVLTQLHAHPDQLFYIPFIGVIAALAVFITQLTRHSRTRQVWAATLTCGVLAGFSVLTAQQIRTWESNSSVWAHAEKVNHQNWIAKVQLGLLELKANNLPAAREYARNAIELQPENLDCQAFNGRVEIASEQWRAAEVTFLNILDSVPNHRDALLGMSLIHSERYEYKQAEKSLDFLLNQRPHDVFARMQLSLLKAHQREFYDAQIEARKAVDSAPDSVPALKLAGRLCAKVRDDEEAIGYLKRATQLFPNDIQIQELLVEVLERGGRFEEAAPFREMIETIKQSPQIVLTSEEVWN